MSMNVMKAISQNLPIRESLLGVIKAKDRGGRNIIHSSDFNSAIAELGFSMGSPLIEDMLIYCKLDANGNLDYSELERELIRQRRIFNAKSKPEAIPVATSSGVVSKPWRGDEIHKARKESERQLLAVTEYSQEINQIYNLLSHHQISAEEAIQSLQQYDIYPTKEFRKIVQDIELNPIPFADFVRSLTKFKAESTDLESKEVRAGCYRVRPELHGETIGSQRKRVTGMRTAFHESANLDQTTRTYRKMITDQKVNDQVIFKNKEIKNILFFDEENGNVPLLSHNLKDMVSGATGVEVDVNYNIDQRLHREQLCAALRKLDTGEITMEDFQDTIFSIGIDIPENFIGEIRRGVLSGRLDIRRYLKMLDANIFKSEAIDTRVHDGAGENAILKFKNNLLSLGYEAFQNLSEVFKKADLNSDGNLTFAEFKSCCQNLQILRGISENELRAIFHAFDSNGDGYLQCSEFIDNLRGTLTSKRKQLVRKAFQKLDRHGSGEVPLDLVGEAFNPAGHPQVISGEKTPKEATTDFLRWFTLDDNLEGVVSFQSFLQYFANLSSCVDNDDEFVRIIATIWDLSDMAPPPPMRKVKKGKEVVTPCAMQTHGDLITWRQLQSSLEEKEVQSEQQKGRKLIGEEMKRNFQSDVVQWKNHHLGSTKAPHEARVDELRALGVDAISSGRKNQSSQSLLQWVADTPSKSPVRATPQSVREVKLPFQEEFPVAGQPTHRSKDKSLLTPSKTKIQQYYSLSKPYGVDEDIQKSRELKTPAKSPSAKSLSEVTSANKQKTLAEYLNN